MKTFIKYWLPVLLWALVIFSFSSYSVGSATQIYWKDFAIKKTAHMVEYAILTVLNYRALLAQGIKTTNAALVAMLISVIYGASDEYHQSFTPGREPKVRDVIFDTIGSILAMYVVWNWVDRFPEKIKIYFKKLEII